MAVLKQAPDTYDNPWNLDFCVSSRQQPLLEVKLKSKFMDYSSLTLRSKKQKLLLGDWHISGLYIIVKILLV